MNQIYEKSNKVALRLTEEKDLDFVVETEHNIENCLFVRAWEKSDHLNLLSNNNRLHLIVEEVEAHQPVGHVILSGHKGQDHNIEFRRIVISEKGKGYGRETVNLVKKFAFERLNAHRLWLDVKEHNQRAFYLYKSLGFKKEGLLREAFLYEGKYESLIIMSILENEYFYIKKDM
ncbi:GNAT family N-acetyltransferase [Chengkuizengella axinellae]|uniref:GNAT family protein n=1 Tax=Chengkuizengella axinellae TaxID=3064388 RepID=A0ABT9IU69_9BACL|nr:GNAT family protein [Chengkuizengella sp. 2205SS18-9]MDP5272868.1 GNAT family protein [Chengkuizengella sp. 2205SS18-9]